MLYRLCMILCFLPATVWGAEQELPDPTKPFGFDIEPELIIQQPTDRQKNVTWQLTGIRIAKSDRSAILNGRVVRVGDSVNGARVLEIEPAWVVIEHEKKRIRLELLDYDIKQNNRAMAQNNNMEPN